MKMTDEDWHAVLNVCLYGTFATCRAIIPLMMEAQYGRIVNISSRPIWGIRVGELLGGKGGRHRVNESDRQGSGALFDHLQHGCARHDRHPPDSSPPKV